MVVVSSVGHVNGEVLFDDINFEHHPYEDCNEAEPHRPGVRRGVAAYALDSDKAARLWQVSVDMLAERYGPGCASRM